ncbi:MAG: hypothetical protein COZ47_02395 [Lysobacterales bacterium CG_4_10_14_3_um_filter_64_11]|nr:MAG: hypothetical protein COZ47_02395 [Xanthomonadales bacterium CG_4_10_14_3_um_filter_64_11]
MRQQGVAGRLRQRREFAGTRAQCRVRAFAVAAAVFDLCQQVVAFKLFAPAQVCGDSMQQTPGLRRPSSLYCQRGADQTTLCDIHRRLPGRVVRFGANGGTGFVGAPGAQQHSGSQHTGAGDLLGHGQFAVHGKCRIDFAQAALGLTLAQRDLREQQPCRGHPCRGVTRIKQGQRALNRSLGIAERAQLAEQRRQTQQGIGLPAWFGGGGKAFLCLLQAVHGFADRAAITRQPGQFKVRTPLYGQRLCALRQRQAVAQ